MTTFPKYDVPCYRHYNNQGPLSSLEHTLPPRENCDDCAAIGDLVASGTLNPYGIGRYASVLPLDSVSFVYAGTQVSIVAHPQTPFRPVTMRVSSYVADAFMLSGIYVGKRMEWFSSGEYGLSMAMFNVNAPPVEFITPMSLPGEAIRLSVVNMTGAAMRFQAALLGHDS
jgi:hypothetical protein